MADKTRAFSPTFVGRQEELARLEALLDAVRSGTTAAALVVGEAGIGKTRILEELVRRAESVDAVALTGGCVPLGEEVLPYAPFVEILSDLLRQRGVAEVLELAGPTADELGRLVPALAVGGPLPSFSRASAGKLYQALVSLIEGLARRRPVLLVVEDLHWADQSTRDLLALLARHLRGRVLVALSFRTDEVPEHAALRSFATELERFGAQRIALGTLSRQDQARQLSGILGVPPPASLLDRIYAKAEGNPFFAEELLALGGDDVPATVRDLLLARLDALPDSTRAALRAAAAAGRLVTHALLGIITGLADEVLDEALRPAVAAHVLVGERSSGAAYRFRHALLRDAIADTLLPDEALRLHRRIAEALTDDPDLSGVAGGSAGRIARHWHAAGDAARTLQASCAAAEEATEALAFNEALAHYERAIALLDVVPDADAYLPESRYVILWFAAETAHLAAHPHRAAELIRAAIDVVDDSHPHHPAYLHERLGRYLWMAADGEAALRSYERAVEIDPPDVSCWRAAILSGYAQILMLAGRFAESVPWCEEAIRLVAQVDDARSTEGHARNNLGVNLAALGDVEAGIEQLRIARTIAEQEFDDVDDIGRAIVNLHSVLFDAGRFTEAAEVAVDGIAVIDRLGLQRRKGVWCRCDAVESLTTLGNVGQAAELIEEALALDPDGIDRVRVRMIRGRLLLRRGALADAEADLQWARAAGARIVDGQLQAPLFAALVDVLVARGEMEQAVAAAAEGAQRMRPDEDAAICAQLFAAATAAAAQAAVASRAAGDDAAADEAAALAARWVDAIQAAVDRDAACKPPAAAFLLTARAELSQARGDARPDQWAAAALAWAGMGDRYRAASAHWRRAEAQLVCGEGRVAAAGAAASARSLALQIGAAHLVAEIDTLARRARLRPSGGVGRGRAGAAPYGLTGRESEVLALVAAGRTDRQIGEQLFISHRTAERHVANILAKFGAATRSEATALAHRSGLVP